MFSQTSVILFKGGYVSLLASWDRSHGGVRPLLHATAIWWPSLVICSKISHGTTPLPLLTSSGRYLIHVWLASGRYASYWNAFLFCRCFHICDFHRYHFLWKSGPWTRCRPKPNYGPCEDVYGVQNRNVTCVTKCGDAASADYICGAFEPKPPTEQICKLPSCPEDCIMTEFSPWSSCDSCSVLNQVKIHVPTPITRPKKT